MNHIGNDVLKQIWNYEIALKENVILADDAQRLQKILIDYLSKVLPDKSIYKLRFNKIITTGKFTSWWKNSKGYSANNPWNMINPFLVILEQYESEKTLKNRLETDGLFVESRVQNEDQHLLIGLKNDSGNKAHLIIDGKNGEIRIEDNQKEPTEILQKIETILTLPNGKKIKTSREVVEEMKE